MMKLAPEHVHSDRLDGVRKPWMSDAVGGRAWPIPRWLGPVLAAVLPLALAFYLDVRGPDPLWVIARTHFLVVSIAFLLTGMLAVVLGVAGQRQRNVQVTFIALAFSSLTLLTMLHGLATPGILLGSNPVIGVTSHLSLALTAGWLALSALPSSHPVVDWLSHRQGSLVGVWTAALVALVAWGLARPESWTVFVVSGPSSGWILATAVTLLFAFAGAGFWRAYRYSRMPLPGAMTYACCWLAASEWIVLTTEAWRASWWVYHVLIVAAIGALLVGVARQYAGRASISDVTRGLFLVDAVERIEVGLSEGVRALVRATEAHDPYTGGHSYRVALTAVRVGQRLGLDPTQLRALAQGGLVHDVGKLEIPDRVLNKEGGLDEEEMAGVREHPDAGYRMCRSLGFMREELEIIRYHHERYDGTGYPEGLAGEEIPILARVLAVADVYDALVSRRAYRDPWSHARALRHIRQERGSAFDPTCVDAFLAVADEGPVVAASELPPWSLSLAYG